MCCFRDSSSANLESHSLQKNVPFSARGDQSSSTGVMAGTGHKHFYYRKETVNSPQLESEYSE